MRDKVQQFGQWAESHWLALVIIMVTCMLMFLLLVLLSWLIGYWTNAIYHTSFELESCWSGVAAIGTGLGSVAALATAAWAKYHTDSKYNSDDGNPPTV
ncbi:hypothetical protein HMPREF0889_0273 [Megasphaera lornae]|uniref:Uncharacterized protein n=1 Tax=Megasphaera lornae TaxID=1000568 RepID=D3LVE9_9FIRM|nr:hypothetical protein [Megasphaera genomosp. type_1]EFD93876.1 hypothetical protein HMPREF0889_0273 [Megasphaera genomosp. type_1 str. 28L]